MDTASGKHKVLIVEDEIELLEVLADRFKQEGFIVLSARNGEEGLQLALEELPDIILLDLIMPKMDGMTALKKLRQDPKGKDVPVILLTNLSTSDKIAEALQNEAYDYLVK